MTQTSPSAEQAKLMRTLIDALRDAPPPELDWQRVEQGLERRIAQDRRAGAEHGATSSWLAIAGFVAAAAALVLLATSRNGDGAARLSRGGEPAVVELSSPKLALHATPLGAPAFLVSALPAKARIVSGGQAVRFTTPEVATWEIGPGSEVVVDRTATPQTVALLRGSLHAQVVPRHDPQGLIETFAVEAGTTHIAVHGTDFTVHRLPDHVVVAVAHGTVTVGPAGHRGITTGHLLVGPAQAMFSLHDGRLLEEGLPAAHTAVATGQTPLPGRTANSSMSAARAIPEPATRAPERPSTGPRAVVDAELPSAHSAPAESAESAESAEASGSESAPRAVLALDTARSLVRGCLEQSLVASPGGPAITISSRVTAVPNPAGKIVTVRFSPPLKPDLQQRCGALLFGRKLAKPAPMSFQVRLVQH